MGSSAQAANYSNTQEPALKEAKDDARPATGDERDEAQGDG